MNAWNSDFVHKSYDKQMLGFLTNFDGKTQLHATKVAHCFRVLVEEGHDPNDRATLEKAREKSQSAEESQKKIPFETLNWLSFTMMLSELGKKRELDDLLEYADANLNPTWVNGGLYYPRNSQLMDSDFNLTHIEPHSGNAGVGYARLNVPDGQKTMWEKAWTHDVLAQRPWVDGDAFADDIDFGRGIWDEERSAMIITARRWRGESLPMTLTVRNLPQGFWGLFVDGKLTSNYTTHSGGEVTLTETVGMEEVDIVLQRVPEEDK